MKLELNRFVYSILLTMIFFFMPNYAALTRQQVSEIRKKTEALLDDYKTALDQIEKAVAPLKNSRYVSLVTKYQTIWKDRHYFSDKNTAIAPMHESKECAECKNMLNTERREKQLLQNKLKKLRTPK